MNTQKRLNTILWISQTFIALLLFYAAFMKLLSDKHLLGLQWPWTASHPNLTIFTGFMDFAGGIGLLLPGLLGWSSRWTIVSAMGTIFLMIAAIAFHILRGEITATPFNLFILLILVFIVWGRKRMNAVGLQK